MTDVAGRRVTVLGFGRREGVSLVHFLVKEGATVLVSDRQPLEQLQESLAATAGLPLLFDLPGHDEERILSWSEVICVTPVIPRDIPLLVEGQRRGITITSEVELFFERCPAPIIGVTGSAGKTTTTSLIGEILTASGHTVLVGGNIGRPLLNALPAIGPTHQVVMELSSFQLQPMRCSPQGAVVTNISPNHLDRHADMEEYTAAKRTIVAYQKPQDWAVLNAADPTTSAFAGCTAARVGWFGCGALERSGDAAQITGGHLVLRFDGPLKPIMPEAEILLPGRHNRENAAAAVLAAARAGGDRSAMANVLRRFRGVAHRLQLVGSVAGVRFYDDSIATTPERMMAALRSFDDPLVVIAGGRDKHLPWNEAAVELCRRSHHVVLTGEASPVIRTALAAAAEGTGRQPVVLEQPSFDGAVDAAVAAARPGDVVLLSPGGTSFDQFRDFAERGERFAARLAATPGFEPVRT